jgi:hypothetical protein
MQGWTGSHLLDCSTICSAMTTISELIRNSFIVLSCCNCTQKHKQYVPLKVACINESSIII